MLYPTSYLKSKGLGKARARHRRAFLGRQLGPVIGHVSPEAAEGGDIAWSRPATSSPSTFPPAPSTCWSRPRNSPAAAPRWKPRRDDAWQPAKPRRAQGFGRASGLCRDDHQRGARRRARSGAVEAGTDACARRRVLLLVCCLRGLAPGSGDPPDVPMVTIDCATGGAPDFAMPGRACGGRRAALVVTIPAVSPLAESG
jgi:hypothetical protein